MQVPLDRCRVNVHCALDVDAGSERFAIIPLPGQLESAFQTAEQALAANLEQLLTDLEDTLGEEFKPIPIYYGQP